MFKFANPEYLYLLSVLVLMVALRIISNVRRKKRIEAYGDWKLLSGLMPDLSTWRNSLQFWLLFAAFGLGCIMLARPSASTILLNVSILSARGGTPRSSFSSS